jgi:hypothetical protein
MSYNAHEVADQVISKLAAHKVIVDAIKSTNRHNEKSAYLDAPVIGKVRVSDHSANESFLVGVRYNFVRYTADEIAKAILNRIEERRVAASGMAASRNALAAKEAAEKAAKQALIDVDNANRQRKADFFASRPDLKNQTETVKRKAWDSFKKGVKA